MLGKKKPRQRVLSDLEIAAVWHASGKLREPWRSFYRLLMLTGARKTEVSDARWREFDLAARSYWTVPPERFKSDAVHFVPLSPAAVELLEQIPRGTSGEFVFSTTDGRIPIDGFSKSKAELDGLVALELGAEPSPGGSMTFAGACGRSSASCAIPSDVSRAQIGHALPAMQRVYDQHAYLDERREALELWAGRLRDIVTPPPANLAKLEERRTRA